MIKLQSSKVESRLRQPSSLAEEIHVKPECFESQHMDINSPMSHHTWNSSLLWMYAVDNFASH